MNDKKLLDNLNNLIIASLISEGEIDSYSHSNELAVPFGINKSLYLLDIIRDGHLKSYLQVDSQKEEYIIHSYPLLDNYRNQWYQGESKIFSKVLDPNLLDLISIVICINLFGTRKIESISIPTTIEKGYLKSLTYCMEKHLLVPVIPDKNHIKITNVTNFIENIIQKIPAIHSAALINFLTNKERKDLLIGGRSH